MIQYQEAIGRVLFAALILLPAAVWHWSAGRSQRRGSTFFGARVEPGFAESDAGRAISRTFHLRLWLIAIAMAAMAQSGLVETLILNLTTVSAAGWIAFALAHRRTRQQASATAVPAARVASLMAAPESPWLTALDWVAMIVPVTAPTATLIILAQYGTGFSEQFLSRHYFSAVYTLSIGLMCSANQFALRYRSRPSDWASDPGASHKYRTYLGVMIAAVFTIIGAKTCALTLMDFRLTVPWLRNWSMSGYFLITFPLAALWLFGVWRMKWWLSRHLATESVDPMPDACWKGGLFYFNRQDPALVVPARSGVGFSYNYARPSVCVVIVVILAFSIAAVVR
ncbi:MAG: hypothetical protein ABIQ86_03720 [Steroidobacteraceae bacterium]